MRDERLQIEYAHGNLPTEELVSTLAIKETVNFELEYSVGNKQYELSNHLGNVLSVISDIKTPVSSGTVVSYYESVVISSQDYSPFGVTLSGRSWSEGYRYGFNGQEVEDGITGSRTHTSAEFWMYDARLGRRWEIDPMNDNFPGSSGYSINFNSPLFFKDPDGDCPWCAFFDYSFQVVSNLIDGKGMYDSFIGYVDFLSVGANLIPGGKALFKGIKLLADVYEVKPNEGLKRKNVDEIVAGKVASEAAGMMRKGLEKMSSKKTLKKVEQRMTKSQNNLKKAEDKLKKHPNSDKMKARVLKSEQKLRESTQVYKDTKQINEMFGKLDDSQWDELEKVMEKSIEDNLESLQPKEIQCPHF